MDKWIELCIVYYVVKLGIVSVVVEVLGFYWVIVNWYIDVFEEVFSVRIFICYVCGYILIELGEDVLWVV